MPMNTFNERHSQFKKWHGVILAVNLGLFLFIGLAFLYSLVLLKPSTPLAAKLLWGALGLIAILHPITLGHVLLRRCMTAYSMCCPECNGELISPEIVEAIL